MLLTLHYLLMAAYLLTPIGLLARGLVRWRRGERKAITGVTSAFAVALGLAIGLNLAYALFAGASVRVMQVLVLTYWIAAIILMLRGLSRAMEWSLRKLLRLPTGHRVSGGQLGRALIGAMVRTVLLIAVGLSFVMASIMTFRPKVRLTDNPQQQLGAAFQSVIFNAADGTRLDGWWIPSPQSSDRTVIVCHGLGANKSNQLSLAGHFVPEGFNVLIFDFRAHGHSGGQLSSFGDRERQDVLAAVRFLKQTRPADAEHVFGVGASMGAAALIAAAADDSPEGQAIEAVAVYGAYDSLVDLTRDIADRSFAWPIDRLVMRVALPLASVHAGTNLADFSPAALVDRVAPRPLLFIHGTDDRVIPFTRGEALYKAASQPRYFNWIQDGDHNAILNDPAMGKIVAEFFRTARPAL